MTQFGVAWAAHALALTLPDTPRDSRSAWHRLCLGAPHGPSGRYVVDTGSDGAGALDRLRTTKYEAIVLDMKLPDMDGCAIAKHVRTLAPNQQKPIIMVTATTPERDAVTQGFDAGALMLLRKPFTAATLRSTVRGVVTLAVGQNGHSFSVAEKTRCASR